MEILQKNLVVNKNSTYELFATGTTPITYGIDTDVVGSNCPSELVCSLDKANGIYAVGTETFNYSTIGNANYSSNYVLLPLFPICFYFFSLFICLFSSNHI